MVHADIDPAGVRGQVVHAVWDGLRCPWTHREETVVLHADRVGLGSPFPPGHRELSQMFLLLGVHTDYRFACVPVLLDLIVDVPELGITIGMLLTLQCLAVPLRVKALVRHNPSARVLLASFFDLPELATPSGMRPPLHGLAVPCRLKPLSRNTLPTVGAET